MFIQFALIQEGKKKWLLGHAAVAWVSEAFVPPAGVQGEGCCHLTVRINSSLNFLLRNLLCFNRPWSFSFSPLNYPRYSVCWTILSQNNFGSKRSNVANDIVYL